MSGLSLNRSKNLNNDKATTFTQNAPVQTHVNTQVNEEPRESEPAEIKETEIEEVQTEQQGEKYPWRRHHANTPVDVLWGTKKKKTVEIPLELALRLVEIKNQKKPKRFGDKIDETSLIIEYLEEGTKKDLKALGYSVK